MARILIGEPDAEIRRLLDVVVARLGHEPVLDDADIFLFEPASLPCLELARRLRRERPDVGLVALSIEPPGSESRELAPIGHVMKPFVRAELAAALAAAS